MSVTETLTLPFDASALLTAGQAPLLPHATLVNLTTGASTTPQASPTVRVNTIDQQISGPHDLVAPGQYLLTINFTADPSVNVWAMELTVIATV